MRAALLLIGLGAASALRRPAASMRAPRRCLARFATGDEGRGGEAPADGDLYEALRRRADELGMERRPGSDELLKRRIDALSGAQTAERKRLARIKERLAADEDSVEQVAGFREVDDGGAFNLPGIEPDYNRDGDREGEGGGFRLGNFDPNDLLRDKKLSSNQKTAVFGPLVLSLLASVAFVGLGIGLGDTFLHGGPRDAEQVYYRRVDPQRVLQEDWLRMEYGLP